LGVLSDFGVLVASGFGVFSTFFLSFGVCSGFGVEAGFGVFSPFLSPFGVASGFGVLPAFGVTSTLGVLGFLFSVSGFEGVLFLASSLAFFVGETSPFCLGGAAAGG